MGQIILLAFGAAIFPTLLACVAIMLSRPQPRALLLGFYLGGLLTSVISGIVVLSLFNNGNSIGGTTTSTSSPGVYIVSGLIALLFSWLMASDRGRSYLARRREHHPRKHSQPKPQTGPSRIERTLSRASARTAFAVGAVINLPGPFYLLALGDISTGDYSSAQELGLILLFNAIMFLLVEVPLVGYIVRPDTTVEKVAAFSKWLNANGLRVIGWLIGIWGTGLLVQGVSAALG